MREEAIKIFNSGIQNSVSDEIIAKDAGSGGISWQTRDGRIELVRGRQEYGVNTTIVDDLDEPTPALVGGNYDQVFAPAQNGERRHYRKINERIQLYLNGDWVDVIVGLTEFTNVFFAPYASLAGNFLYIGSQDGLYKINLAHPRDYKDMFDANKNHKGFILINESRMFLWNRFDGQSDKTALYLSKIDPQGTNYTTVTNEDIGNSGSANYTGTLAGVNSTRFIFGLSITGTTASGVETFIDNQDGTLTSDKGGTGTINYATGVFDITFDETVSSGDIEATYQYEDSNVGGVTDFTFSSPRVAGEGDFIPQEYLGEPIQNVVPFDNRYYSFKTTSVYELDLTADDTNATNNVFRSDIGVVSPKGLVPTGKGIAYMDVANPDKPILSMLVRNPVGGNLEPIEITPLFAWENYRFDQCVMDTWGEFVLVSCRTPASDQNNRLMLVNTTQKYSVDITYYGVKSLAKNNGLLFGGSPVSEVTYELFRENDDLGSVINNFWISKNENFGDDRLKKVRYLELKGLIDSNQYFEVYVAYDNDTNILVGTVRGDADYVDLSNPQLVEVGVTADSSSQLIGGDPIGNSVLGGGIQSSFTGDSITAYNFHTRLRIKTPKFRVRKVVLIAKAYGFLGVNLIKDHDLMIFEQKLPRRMRIKQYVSQDGIQTDLPTFQS